MALYNGLNIFGGSVSVIIRDTPVERQENSYPGLSGIESIPMGGRGRFAEVSGVLAGVSGPDLTTAENLFRSYKDGLARPLVDNSGFTWIYAILESFDPAERVLTDARYGYFRRYNARFRLLI